MQQIYVFLGPVAVALTANVVCFLVTLVSIERTMRASRSALSSQPNSDKQRLLVYTKMVCVMGFTWAAGFLAAFTEQPAFWWVYILLNGLQGTFIAFSFFLNTRLLRFLKAKATKGKKTKEMILSRTVPSAVAQGLSHPSPAAQQRRICVQKKDEVVSDGGDVVLTSVCSRQNRSSDSTATINTSV
ncbi:adhesion G protein-coupled receptor E2-like [Littorina saxatilis]